ncbi:2OG-Fe(II) oxygenase [Stenotrophomonas sp. PFBMAA-4]|uniref:2OG-Fe(II) oxygenase n=1 Tax=Stenotrophomonas sp. PFBMAA-4 TaxID=3043301 RepID=UPI0024B5D0E0|nr:2OG-Fe(II) oxygenase [Stenotrophomonas sp. PFBMAA-4]MDI9271795.1 2OG-Fe(II) oxygenase [Stenotrophomonas sp. PFBMAA-4]
MIMTTQTLFTLPETSLPGPLPVDYLSLEDRIEHSAWNTLETQLTREGLAVLPGLLSPAQCRQTADLFLEEDLFRSRIVMERYAFGRGVYKYFRYPLPDLVGRLRESLYSHLAPIANRWHTAMRIGERFPATHAEFREICNRAGQPRPTPLLLRYQAGDYCCLHQDLYGDHVFPLQVVFLLDQPGRDFEGGELLLTESDPKRPGRAEVVPLGQGDAVVFAVNHRPVRSARGFYRANLRHGVSRLLAGQRHTLGIIFHDAK